MARGRPSPRSNESPVGQDREGNDECRIPNDERMSNVQIPMTKGDNGFNAFGLRPVAKSSYVSL